MLYISLSPIFLEADTKKALAEKRVGDLNIESSLEFFSSVLTGLSVLKVVLGGET